MMLKAILFDYDGVLVDSRDVGMTAYKAIAETFGRTSFTSMADFRRAQKKSFRQTFGEWGASTEDRIAQAERTYREVTAAHKEKIKLIPGMKKVLQQLSKTHTLAIVSGTYRELLEPMLHQFDIHKYFTHIITRDDVQHVKPAPEGLHRCLSLLKLKPHEVLFIGDMTIDIEMGRSAGVRTAILTPFSWNAIEDLKESKPDVLLQKPEHILATVHG